MLVLKYGKKRVVEMTKNIRAVQNLLRIKDGASNEAAIERGKAGTVAS
jgi:hypothetical protein